MNRSFSPRAESGLLIGLALVVVIIQCLPAMGEALQWRRSAALPISAITTLTGHLTHWTWDHLLWDVIAFIGLGFAAIQINPGRFIACLLLAAILIPIEITLFLPQFETYRGLSGIDSALFGLLIAGLWQLSKKGRLLAALGFAGFLGKTVFELMTGDTLFVARETTDFTPVTSAHLVGLVCGILAGNRKLTTLIRFFLTPRSNHRVGVTASAVVSSGRHRRCFT